MLGVAAMLCAGLGACGAPVTAYPGQAWPGSRFTPEVYPVQESLSLAITAAEPRLGGAERARIADFAQGYRQRGHGGMEILMPGARLSARQGVALLSQINRVLDGEGVDTSRVNVITRTDAQTATAPVILLRYTSHEVTLPACGHWAVDPADLPGGQRAANFGCAVTRSLAAIIADPADLTGAAGDKDRSR